MKSVLKEYIDEILKDERAKLGDKIAACVLILSKDGRVLAVSRKDDPNAWGLPGGKVDPGETPREAAERECQEETGLATIKLDLEPILDFKEDDGYRCLTFRAVVDGEIDTDEAGVVRWIDPALLISSSPFSRYNRILLNRCGLL